MKKSLKLYAKTANIKLTYIPYEDIERHALRTHNDTELTHGNYRAVIHNQASPVYIKRVVLNYIRHNLSDYDIHLAKMKKWAGRQQSKDAAAILKERVDDMIVEAWKL